MKQIIIKNIALGFLVASVQLSACKSKPKDDTTTTPVSVDTSANMSTPSASAPIEIAPNDSLQIGVTDAVKDFSGVTGTVNDGEITLTGEIKRDRLPKLMQSINSLHPKKINNNLTIK